MSEVNKLLLHVLLLVLINGSIAGLLAGAALVLRPAWLLYVGMYLNRWIPTRPITKLLERMIKVDRWFYRYHYASGILLLASSVFLINFFSGHFDKVHTLTMLSSTFSYTSGITDILVDAAVFTILLGAAFALIISLFMLIRPSMLKGFEQSANQWFSIRRALKPFEVSRFGLDEFVFQNVQMTGVFILCGSLYTLSVLTIWL